MKKVFVLIIVVVSLVLSACDLNPKPTTPSTPTISKKTISGQVQNYTAGAAELKAQLVTGSGPGMTIGTGSVTASGALSLELNPVPDALLEENFLQLGTQGCSNVSATPSTFKGTTLGLITLEQDGIPLGVLFQASSPEFLGDFMTRAFTDEVIPGKIILWLYADRAVRLTAQCATPESRYDLPGQIDISLQPGWNALVNEVTTTEISLTSEPTDLPWLFGN
jgi:hypothetical protein